MGAQGILVQGFLIASVSCAPVLCKMGALNVSRFVFFVSISFLGVAAGTSQHKVKDSRVDIPTMEIAHGVHMPVLSIGTGGLETSAAETIVSNWLEIGGRGIDTALVYRDQASVANAINKSGLARKDLFITTKIPGCFLASAAVEHDLKTLGVEYIDLMLIHSSMGYCPGTWKVLESFHAKGVLKSIGVSNFKKSSLESILKEATVKPAVNQIEYNILQRDDETVEFSKANNITIEAYSPLGRSGHSGDIPGNNAIQKVARAHNVSTYQVALRWIVQHGNLLTFQSSSQAHQAEDADIFGFVLADEEMSVLDSLHNVTLREHIVVV